MKNMRKPITYCNFFKELFYLFYVYAHVSMYLHMSEESEEARRGHWSPSELELQVGVNCQVLESNSNSLQGKQVLLPTSLFPTVQVQKMEILITHLFYTQACALNYNIHTSNCCLYQKHEK